MKRVLGFLHVSLPPFLCSDTDPHPSHFPLSLSPPPSLLFSLSKATGFRRFVAADEVAQWFATRLSSPPSSSSVPNSRRPSLPRCRYFSMQEEKWRTCNAFPLPSTFRTFRLVAGGGLVEGEGEGEEGGEGGREGGREGGTTMTLHVDLHKARISKGPTRYTAMTHVFLPVRRLKGGGKDEGEGGNERQ